MSDFIDARRISATEAMNAVDKVMGELQIASARAQHEWNAVDAIAMSPTAIAYRKGQYDMAKTALAIANAAKSSILGRNVDSDGGG
jgi:hypothetical protein